MADQLSVRVRMFRQGLGDCFLLTFARPTHPDFQLLIDCGVLKGTDGAADKMRQVVRAIGEATGGTIDLLVVTHEHWDHVSGFHQARAEWDALTVRHVWMAWTEGDGELARGLRERRAETLAQLRASLQRLGPGLHDEVAALLGFLGDGLAAAEPQTTRGAMAYALAKGQGRHTFHSPGGDPIELDALPGVRFYVLGPPMSSLLLKDSPSRREGEVYTGSETRAFAATFFSAVARLGEHPPSADEIRSFPFDAGYRVSPEDARAFDHFARYYFGDDDLGRDQGWRRIDADWLEAASTLALALDEDTNNTSLALAIELTKSGKVLLFPGDAQVGSWLSWHGYSWKVPAPGGQIREVRAEDLLRRTVLYKVAHHGSHNATLSARGLELMGESGLVALIPVDEQLALQQGTKGWKMPFGPLYERLKEKTGGRIIRADLGKATARHERLSDAEWARFQELAVECPLYVDYHISE